MCVSAAHTAHAASQLLHVLLCCAHSDLSHIGIPQAKSQRIRLKHAITCPPKITVLCISRMRSHFCQKDVKVLHLKTRSSELTSIRCEPASGATRIQNKDTERERVLGGLGTWTRNTHKERNKVTATVTDIDTHRVSVVTDLIQRHRFISTQSPSRRILS